MQNESISLYFRDGSSDKVYNATLEAKDGGFVVNFAYGRRGASLTTGSKTDSPVDYAKAKKAFDKLVQEKTAKGYKPSGSAPAAINAVVKTLAERNTGMLPQLLNPIDEKELAFFMSTTSHGLQEKMDGRRLMVQKKDGKITAANRKGQEIPLKKEFEEELARFPNDFIIDGEDCGNIFWVFDCLLFKDTDISKVSYKTRWDTAGVLLFTIHIDMESFNHSVRLVPLAKEPKEKKELFEEVKKRNGEGVVIKVLSAGYTPGRPNAGGNQLKFKFVASATCRVTGQNGTKRSVSLACFGDNNVGNVTIPANFDIPKIGQLVEVRYLYAYKGGSLFQPVYLGVRTDIDKPDTLNSLKYKAEGEEDE